VGWSKKFGTSREEGIENIRTTASFKIVSEGKRVGTHSTTSRKVEHLVRQKRRKYAIHEESMEDKTSDKPESKFNVERMSNEDTGPIIKK